MSENEIVVIDEDSLSIQEKEVHEDKMEMLVNEFSNQRNSLNDMIVDLEKIKEKIEMLFPENMDKRYIRFFEEKMKAMTSLFGTILDIKKEIMKGLKTEIDMRKALGSSDDESDEAFMENFNVHQMVDRLDSLTKSMNIQKEKRISLRTKGEKHVRIDE